jgi:TRAP-type C4-dicarboxylate transport system substrate-binding protein
MNNPRKVRWLIAHQPQDLFVRTAQAFKEELLSQGLDTIEIEILTYPEYSEKYTPIEGLDTMQDYNDENYDQGLKAFWKALEDSTVEMSQVQVNQVGELYSDFDAIDLPFIFDDHDHVSRVLEGEIGQELCTELGRRSPVTGLAFTYSGGYRVIGSNEPITGINDLQGLKIVVQKPLTLGTTIESMGGEAVTIAPNLWNKFDVLNNGIGQAIETTYLRFEGKHILKTNHSMFMTTILISNKFWKTLSESEQNIFRKAAFAAARKERQWSIDDAEKFEQAAADNGIKIIDISQEDRKILKQKSQLTYAKCKYHFTDGLIKRIRTLH